MGRISNAEKARRAAEQAEKERKFAEYEAECKAMEERNKPYVDGLKTILDNIDLGPFSSKWGNWNRSVEVISDKHLAIGYSMFDGDYHDDHYYGFTVGFNKDTQQFTTKVRQRRMGEPSGEDLEKLINETAMIKTYLERIKVATDKALDYAKANGLTLM